MNQLVNAYHDIRFTAAPSDLSLLAAQALQQADAESDPDQRFLALSVGWLAYARAHSPEAEALIGPALAAYEATTLPATPEVALQAAHLMALTIQPQRVRGIVRPVLETDDLDAAMRARLLSALGVSDAWSGALVPGELALREARELAAATGQVALRCEVTGFLSKVECFRGRVEQAIADRAEARTLAAELGSEWVASGLLEVGVYIALATGDAEAHRSNLEMLVGEQRGRESGLVAEYAYELAHYHALAGDADAARRVMDDVVLVPHWPGAAAFEPWRRWNLALDDPDAWRHLEDAAHDLQHPVEVFLRARLRWLLGRYHAVHGRRGASGRLLDLAASGYAATGAAAFVRAVERDLPGAVVEPLASRGHSQLERLSEAERRVALAVAAGMSNKEAASTLFLSVKTVEFHLGKIFRKAGVRSRTEFIRWVES